MKLTQLAIIGLAAASLIGCSQTPQLTNQYYALGAADLTLTPVPSNNKATLVIKPVELPDYLNSTGVVMQMNDNQVHIAEQHLWAGSLNQQLDRLTLEAITLYLPRWTIVESAQFYPEAGDQYWILSLSVSRFQGRLEGKAVASGRWSLIAPNGQVVKDELFNYQLDVPTRDYPGIVAKLKQNWLALNQDLVRQVVAAAQQK